MPTTEYCHTWRHLTSSTTDLSGGSRKLGPGALRRSPYIPSENKERCTCLSPDQGSTGGGTTVTTTGTSLPNTTKVTFGGKLATSITQVSPTQVTAVSSSGMGTVEVTVTPLYPGATPP
ncbi:IPT/TIG domain-containing protein [Streptomyces sp. NPDC056178]|uniref:IPT/TIG domain-containing protein n=1 Tax=unclassified Streptomyces TaxID=2593676 RepID=UPI0035D5F2B0